MPNRPLTPQAVIARTMFLFNRPTWSLSRQQAADLVKFLRVRDLLRDALEHTGEFEVVAQAADGEEALRAVVEAAPDVIVKDVIMPVMATGGGTGGSVADCQRIYCAACGPIGRPGRHLGPYTRGNGFCDAGRKRQRGRRRPGLQRRRFVASWAIAAGATGFLVQKYSGKERRHWRTLAVETLVLGAGVSPRASGEREYLGDLGLVAVAEPID